MIGSEIATIFSYKDTKVPKLEFKFYVLIKSSVCLLSKNCICVLILGIKSSN